MDFLTDFRYIDIDSVTISAWARLAGHVMLIDISRPTHKAFTGVAGN